MLKFIRQQPRWRLGVAAALLLVVCLWLFRGTSAPAGGLTFSVRRGPLKISVLEGGSIEALESQEIRSEVKGYQGTKILSIVEEGYLVTEEDVKNGKLLVELDSSELKERITTQEIQYQSTLSSLIEAQQAYDIQVNQNLSDVKAAEQKARFARMDVEKYMGDTNAQEIITTLGLFDKPLTNILDIEKIIADAVAPKEGQSNMTTGASLAQGGPNGARGMPPGNGGPPMDMSAPGGRPPGAADRVPGGRAPGEGRPRPAMMTGAEGGAAFPMPAMAEGTNAGPRRPRRNLAEGGEGMAPGMGPGMGQGMGPRQPREGRGPGGGTNRMAGPPPMLVEGSGPPPNLPNVQPPRLPNAGGGAPTNGLAAERLTSTLGTDNRALADLLFLNTTNAPVVDYMKYADTTLLGDGSAKQQLRTLEDELLLSQQEKSLAQVQLEGTQRLFASNFVAKTQLDTEELGVRSKQVRMDKSRTALELFRKYEFVKAAEEYVSKYEEALRLLDRARKEAISKLAQARARLKSAESRFRIESEQLQELYEQRAKCVIRAKRPGLVVYGGSDDRRFLGGEEQIREGATVRERQSIITIPDMTKMAVKLRIHESQIKKVMRGQQARIQVDAYPNEVLTGEVLKVGVLPDSQGRWMNPDMKVYVTSVAINGVYEWLKPGMSAKVEILVKEMPDVLYVPIQAVTPSKGRHVCYLAGGRYHDEREIEVGEFSDEFIEVRKGLKEGERVLLRLPEGVTPEVSDNAELAERRPPSDNGGAPAAAPSPDRGGGGGGRSGGGRRGPSS